MVRFILALAATALFSAMAQAQGIKNDCAWCGPYIGAFVGAGISDNTINFGGLVPDSNATEAIYGGIIGYNTNYQGVLLGLEGEFGGFGSGKDVKSDAGDTDYDIKWVSLIRARLGTELSNGLIAYATAGLALTGVEVFEDSSGLLAGSDTLTGYTVGGGIERMIDQGWAMRLDYAFAHFGQETLSGRTTFVDQTVETDLHLIRLGVTRKLSFGD